MTAHRMLVGAAGAVAAPEKEPPPEGSGWAPEWARCGWSPEPEPPTNLDHIDGEWFEFVSREVHNINCGMYGFLKYHA